MTTATTGNSTRGRVRPMLGFLKQLLFSPDEPILQQKAADDEGQRFWNAPFDEAAGTVPVWRQRTEAELDAQIEASRLRNTKPKKASWYPTPRNADKPEAPAG